MLSFHLPGNMALPHKAVMKRAVLALAIMLFVSAVGAGEENRTDFSVPRYCVLAPILKILHADGELAGYFTAYYRIMLFAYSLMIMSTILGMFVRVDGKPRFFYYF